MENVNMVGSVDSMGSVASEGNMENTESKVTNPFDGLEGLAAYVAQFAALDGETWDSFVKTVRKQRRKLGTDASEATAIPPHVAKILTLRDNGVDKVVATMADGSVKVLTAAKRQAERGKAGGTLVIVRNIIDGSEHTFSTMGDEPEFPAWAADIKSIQSVRAVGDK